MKLKIWMASLALAMTVSSAFAQEEAQELCAVLPEYHYEQPDGVEYVPGAEDVVPADVNPLNAAALEVVDIPVTVDLAQRFAVLGLPAGLELKPDVGHIAVHQDGRVEYNGQDLRGLAYEICASEEVEGETADGQEEGEPLSSALEKTEQQELVSEDQTQDE